jgi:serine/threonine-protein kinase
VPWAKGKTLAAAKNTLMSHDCTVGKITHADSRTIKQGRVISLKPKAGAHLKPQARVDLVVSKG